MQMFKSFEHIDTSRCKCLNHLNTSIPEMQMFKSFLEMEMLQSFELRCKCLNHKSFEHIDRDANA